MFKTSENIGHIRHCGGQNDRQRLEVDRANFRVGLGRGEGIKVGGKLAFLPLPDARPGGSCDVPADPRSHDAPRIGVDDEGLID